MSEQSYPAPAANQREARCDATRTIHDSRPGCRCHHCVALAIASDSRRREIVTVLMALDTTLTTAAVMYAAGGAK